MKEYKVNGKTYDESIDEWFGIGSKCIICNKEIKEIILKTFKYNSKKIYASVKIKGCRHIYKMDSDANPYRLFFNDRGIAYK